MFQYIKDDRGIVTNYYESIRAFPPEGEYFCSELNVTLVFSTQHTTIRYCDGKTDEIHMEVVSLVSREISMHFTAGIREKIRFH